MMGRLLTLAAIAVSLVAFIAEVTGSAGSWTPSLSRVGQVMVPLAIAAALLSERSPSLLARWAQVLAAATTLVFVTVALVKYYGTTYPPFGNLSGAFTWLGEAEVFGLATLAFSLTLDRRRDAVPLAALVTSVVFTVGCAIYAVTLSVSNLAGQLWWSIAEIAAFLAASAAAVLVRHRIFVSSAPVPSSPGGAPGSDPGVE